MKHLKPKGARGRAQVKKLGRNFKTGNFSKIASKAAKEYGSKEAGKRVAGAIFQKKAKSYKKGGKVKKTGTYTLHKGERVLNPQQTQAFDGQMTKMPRGKAGMLKAMQKVHGKQFVHG